MVRGKEEGVLPMNGGLMARLGCSQGKCCRGYSGEGALGRLGALGWNVEVRVD